MFHCLRIFAILIPVLLLSACFSTGNKPAQTSVQLPDTFSQSGTEAAPAKWWLAFNDDHLNTLIEQALTDNPGLLATWSRPGRWPKKVERLFGRGWMARQMHPADGENKTEINAKVKPPWPRSIPW
jgi:hypothetical protein